MATDRQDPEDHHLLQRTARGEEDALAALYAKYATPVYSLARFMLGQPALAEEATQDIFLNIWLKAASDSKRSRRGSGDQGIQHKQFCLGEFHRTGGRQVVWTNRDAARHTTTAGTPGGLAGAWDSEDLEQGNQFTFTFNQAGTFPYRCRIHSSMTGTVTVR